MTDEPRCTFCGETRAHVRFLVSSPRALICDTCIGHATAFVANLAAPRRAMLAACSFCGLGDARGQFTNGRAAICDDCIGLCGKILADQDAIAPLPAAHLVRDGKK